MDINEFKSILAAFADEPSDVDVRLGKVLAQIRDDLIDVSITYSPDPDRHLIVIESDQQYPARSWLINRVARMPQLADRIIASTTIPREIEAQSPFVIPTGHLSPDLADMKVNDEDQAIDDTLEAILRKVTNPLPGATSVMYLTSDAGEGKTTLINRAARIQAQRYKDKTATSLLVPIPLSGRAFLTFDDAVIAALVNKLRFSYLYFDAFIQLVRMGVVVPAFDGYEEMLVEGSKGEAVSALGNLVQSLESSGTIVIAARKAFFDYLSFKTQARLLDAIGDRSASFSRLAISRWSKAQFCHYGQLRKIEAPEGVYETVAARLGEDHPVLTRAVLVRRLFDVVGSTSDRDGLAAMFGRNPHDYFFTFVDAIVKREASEKWLSRVSGDVLEPLLEIEEHHQLLTYVAQEMWQMSTNALRYDVLDVLVDIFADGRGKSASVVRQVKERLKQHSLLASDAVKGQTISFDHEDFQNFYLGEGLGAILARTARAELQAFLSVNLVPIATVDEAVQYLIRARSDMRPILGCLLAINESESGYSFCKENCGALAIRAAECIQDNESRLTLASMLFSPNSLVGRTLNHVEFQRCHFQPTATSVSHLTEVEFKDCAFERLEIETTDALATCKFTNCTIDSLIWMPEDEHTFDPTLIPNYLIRAGASVVLGQQSGAMKETPPQSNDNRLKTLERFLRVFLRVSFVDEDLIRLRLGKTGASDFFENVLPALLENGILEEIKWKGRGVKRRYKLGIPMSEVNHALENANGTFDGFLSEIIRALSNYVI